MQNIKSDLTVIGAGIAGICTAVSAARLGIKVALVNDRDVPGGNASSENRIHVNGGAIGNNSFYSRESGIADELKLTTFYKNPRYNQKKDYHLSDMALLEIILDEKNISYFSSTSAYDCKTENGKITEVYAFCSKTQTNYHFTSPLFCDASGDGIIALKSGAKYRMGREARDEFNESLAPEKADNCLMGSCILFNVTHTGFPVKYVKPKFAYDFVKDDIIKYFDRPKTGRSLPKPGGQYNGMWWLEYGGENDTVGEAREIDFELKKLIYSYWDYIKNSGIYPDAEDCEITWIAPFAAKRESHRFIGDYTLSQADINQETEFFDAVSTGGWSLDVHDVGGIYGNDNTSAFGEVKSMYNIPYRIMYSKDVENLFLAGRTVSCTHIAHGSLRVMETLGAMAQAVGTAAFLCTKYKKNPRQICDNIAEMQDLLQKNGQYIIGRREDCGFAKNAKITAKSEKFFENTRCDTYIPLTQGVTVTIPVIDSVEKIDVWLKNDSTEKKSVTYSVFEQESRTNYILGECVKSDTLTLDENADDFITLPVEYNGSSDKIFVTINKTDDVSVATAYTRVTGCPCFYENHWRMQNGEDEIAICFKGIEKTAKRFSAINVINGFSRPFNQPNLWISKDKSDQYLQLDFDNAPDINEIQIYFNPQFETDHFNHPIAQLITDYNLCAEYKDGVYKKEVRGNYLSRNTFKVSLNGLKKLRFDFLENNGAPEFEVFAVKVF